MDERAQDRDAPAGSSDDTIAPVDFQRADPRDARVGRRLPLAALAVGAALLVLGATAAFTFLAHPTLVVVKPTPETLRLTGGPSFAIGDRYLLLRGAYRIEAELAGHHPLDELFRVPLEDDLLELEMRRLPGRLRLDVEPAVEVEVRVDGTVIGHHPGTELLVEPGEREISLHSERWLPVSRTVRVEGLGREVALSFELEPAWADVSVTSEPPGARLRVDDEDTGLVTPAEAEILAGSRVLTLHLDGYEPARQRIELVPSQTLALPTFELERLAGRLQVSTDPAGASVTVDDAFRGRTPLTLELAPTGTHRIELFKSGHEPETRRVRVESDADSRLDVTLAPVRGELRVAVGPPGARVRVDGEELGPADQVLLLSAEEHEIEVYLDGHVSYTTRVTPRPEFAQEIALTLKTFEQARRDAMKPELIAGNGQTLVLIQPEGPFQLGASRREPGRRANEVLREVEITRPFYIATTELTNAQYRAFESGHDAGSFEQYDLDGDDLPVVNINWEAAARYCNWLSERDGLSAVYRIENGVVRGFDPTANGYRMPTEAEWAYVARTQEDGSLLRFPWGDTRRPPEDRMGNYADRASETLLARSIPDYTDGNVTTAPVGKFDPNRFGLHDIGGNVAEWINDFYAATSTELPTGVQDPLGPPRGEYHVIRGSSWMHGQLVDLRLSFRDYGRQGRPDVGLRIARWFE